MLLFFLFYETGYSRNHGVVTSAMDYSSKNSIEDPLMNLTQYVNPMCDTGSIGTTLFRVP